jgi:MFS transporter, DHA3 family, tetracycline resistance protein
VRATVHSMFGQVDAIGQVLGGPVVAVIASVGSAVAALVTSGLLLTPALFFIRRANSRFGEDAEPEIGLPY